MTAYGDGAYGAGGYGDGAYGSSGPPAVSDLADELYRALGATTAGDEQGWILLHLCQALTLHLQEIQDLAGDAVEHPGWSSLLDVERAPAKALGYLAQFVGVQLAPGLDDASQRLRIASAEGWGRGTPAAVRSAAQQWLTGDRHLFMTERADGSAYRLRMAFYATEVVDADQLQRAVAAAIPAGVVLDLVILPGWTYTQLAGAYSAKTYAQLASDYAGTSYAYLGSVIP